MKPISEMLAPPKVTKLRSRRDTIIADIYAVYCKESQRKKRKVANWKKYICYLKEKRIKSSAIEMAKFKRSRLFIKELPIKTIAILLARNKDEALYRVLSECRDIDNRGGDAGAFIINNRFI